MYPGAVNSPETFITHYLEADDTVITVQSAAGWPQPPYLLVLGNELSNAETVKVIEVTLNSLTVERGHQGMPQAWPQGTTIACNFTEEQYRALVCNINRLKDSTIRDFLLTQPPIADCDDITLKNGWYNIDENTLNTPWNLPSGGLFKISLPDGRIKLQFHAFSDGEVWESVYDTGIDDDGFTQVNGWSHWVQVGNVSGVLRIVTFNNVPLEILQTVINRIPKDLKESYTINADSGTIEDGISIVEFTGRGRLIIIGNSAARALTHNVSFVTITRCSNDRILVRGFTATRENVGFRGTNTFDIHFDRCNAVVAGTTGFIIEGVPQAAISDMMVSNKTFAAVQSRWTTHCHVTGSSTGENNNFLYQADSSSILRIRSEGTISLAPGGRYANASTSGGQVFDSQGRSRPSTLTWHTPVFHNNFSTFGSNPLRYAMDLMGNVHIRGRVMRSSGGMPTGTALFTLPVGFRPLTTHMMTCLVMGVNPTQNVFAVLQVAPNGNVTRASVGTINPPFITSTEIVGACIDTIFKGDLV